MLSLSRSHHFVTAILTPSLQNLEVGCATPLGNLPASNIVISTTAWYILTQIRHFARANTNIDFLHTNSWSNPRWNRVSWRPHLAKVSRSDERPALHRPILRNERLAS